MRKKTYILLLIAMLFTDFILFFIGDTLGGGFGSYAIILSAIFAEVAIYATLIILEIINKK